MKIIFALFFVIMFSTPHEAQVQSVFEKNFSLNQTVSLGQKGWEISKREVNRYSDLVINPYRTSSPDTTQTTSPDSTGPRPRTL